MSFSSSVHTTNNVLPTPYPNTLGGFSSNYEIVKTGGSRRRRRGRKTNKKKRKGRKTKKQNHK